jgi:ubiquinone biosynthesis protein UbiJ
MPKSPQDATLRNVRAAKKRDAAQDAELTTLTDALAEELARLRDDVAKLDRRLSTLENTSRS